MATVADDTRRQRISRGEWASISGMGLAVVVLHILGWGTLALVVAPHHYQLLDQHGKPMVFGLGLGLLAYSLGLRHAFDADHIAAI
ncbi:MAG TPA: HoxN/HupN/NixA family nickel/cobalt transporter, partial [Pseudonocardiaceae bacterium]|nr:HoxN/HupN/NixA family nickel/cobalt transporter [Pseudonocardiaceae bacterium]